MLYVLTNPIVSRCHREFLDQFRTESRREPTPQECDTLLRNGARGGMPDFISWFQKKAQSDVAMSAELRQVANGFEYRVRSFTGYDVNGYHFRTSSFDKENRRTTCFGVFTPGLDNVEYYGRIEEIYELNFRGCKPLTPVVFKCHWFDPVVTRWTHSNLGLVEIR
jgi:hypothetical protein